MGDWTLLVEAACVDDRLGFALAAEYDHEIADHGGAALVIEVDDVFGAELFEGHFDHGDGAHDEGFPRGDDGGGLLAAEHGAGDFGGIGEMGEAAFVDGDAGDAEARDELGAEFAGDLLVIAAQRDFLVLEIIVGIARPDRADGDFDLGYDELQIVIDIEGGLRCVGDAPDELGGDFDRVAARIVDLDLLADEIVGAAGDFSDGDPWPGLAQAGAAIGALIIAKQGEDAGFVGRELVEADEQKHREHGKAEDGEEGCKIGDARKNGGDGHEGGEDDEGESREAISARTRDFAAGIADLHRLAP